MFRLGGGLRTSERSKRRSDLPRSQIRRLKSEVQGSAHHSALLVGEHTLEAIGVYDCLALIGRHRTQVLNRGSQHALPVGWQLLHLLENLLRLLFLLGGQVLPSIHAVEHAQLLLRGQTGKVLESLSQLLLPFRWKTMECRVILERSFLFIGWQIFVATQPIADVALGLRSRVRLLPC